VVVDLAGHEVADDEAPALEHLVHRRRLVHPPRDRLEVGDVERERIQAPVPADDVEGAGRDDVAGAGDAARAAVLDQDLDVGLVGGDGLAQAVQVALAVTVAVIESTTLTLRRRHDRVGATNR
jgi:hypothetical protein